MKKEQESDRLSREAAPAGDATRAERKETASGPAVPDGESLRLACEAPLLGYGSSGGDNGGALESAVSLAYLIFSERAGSADPVLHGRILEHLAHLVAGGKEPVFDLAPHWNYPIVAACLALARATPGIWADISAPVREKLEFVMQCFAVIGALGTDDGNDFGTGPALLGNYGKSWNPNYRLSNVPQMWFCKEFFGGSEQVNAILREFSFDRYLDLFNRYGFTRAVGRWTRCLTPPDDPDMPYTCPRLFMDGVRDACGAWTRVPAFRGRRDDPTGRLTTAGGDPAGSGYGVVAAGEKGYTYQGYTLDQAQQIWENLLAYNYSGGAVISRYGEYPEGVTDERGSRYKAYILDGSESVVQGRPGMMKEFCAGDAGDHKHGPDIRSSIGYCMHDFIMVTACTMALNTLGLYDLRQNPALFSEVCVGNTDFLYKLEHGYVSYSSGKSHGVMIDAPACRQTKDGFPLLRAYWHAAYPDAEQLARSAPLC